MNIFSIVLVFIFYIVSIALKSKKDQKKVIQKRRQTSPHTSPQRMQTEQPKERGHQDIFEQVENRIRNYKEKLNPTPSVSEEEEQIKEVLKERRGKDGRVPSYKKIKEDEVNPIYSQEIGREVNLQFNQDAILKGIIMSEVLSKPKSMKK